MSVLFCLFEGSKTKPKRVPAKKGPSLYFIQIRKFYFNPSKVAKDNEKAEAKKLSAKVKKGGKSIGIEPALDGEYIEPFVSDAQKAKILRVIKIIGQIASR